MLFGLGEHSAAWALGPRAVRAEGPATLSRLLWDRRRLFVLTEPDRLHDLSRAVAAWEAGGGRCERTVLARLAGERTPRERFEPRDGLILLRLSAPVRCAARPDPSGRSGIVYR